MTLFNNVKFCFAGIVSLLALHRSRWDLIEKLVEFRFLQRWFLILTNSCLDVITDLRGVLVTRACIHSIDKQRSSRNEQVEEIYDDLELHHHE